MGPSNAPALPVISAGVVSGAATLTVDAASPLATVGGAALVQSTLGNFLVARTSQNAFTALTAVCTHEICTITGFQAPTYVCPCHGSQFNTSGGVVQGPAAAPLRSFPTTFNNNVLTII
jgi:cytochrome b6-f complex iron-sulfur subunit